MRPVKLILSLTTANVPRILEKYSIWSMLLRITALLFRFSFNCQSGKSNSVHRTGFIKLEEINTVKRYWITQSQSESFADELLLLKTGRMVNRDGSLKTLSPFIDSYDLIRVGGRLANAQISDGSKYPIVLSAKSTVTKLIFNYEHRRLMHIGPQALLSHISINFWIIRGRIIARKTVSKCVQCVRALPKFLSPFMAPLPRERVTIERPFARTGIDFCGFIMVRSGVWKVTPINSYICVFVCMVTRAIHLELVSSLSTADFLATLSRFMSRRGQCSCLYSDNGSNFVGANRSMKATFAKLMYDKKLNDFLTVQEIIWQFIPPSAPHFGGLWESAVKFAKKQLVRTTREVLLTYDETTTMLCRVEAALNSRPLFPMSTDPADFAVLTRGHFLVGGPLLLLPELDVSTVPVNRLRRFTLMHKQMQTFWQRWTKEYLPQVQRRGKWTKVERNVAVGDLAILRDQALPPIHWPLVRIIKTHCGSDELCWCHRSEVFKVK